MRLSRQILLLLAALLLFIVPAGAEESKNLLVNGSFESLDGDGLPSGWYTDAYVYREDMSQYSITEEARTGSVAAVVSNLKANDARFAQRVKVEPNSLYRLSGWIRADEIADSGRGANISVSDVYVFSESVFDSEGEWVYVELYGQTGEDQKELTVFARVGGYSGESIGSAAFDDLRLEKVTALPGGAQAHPWYQQKTESVVYDAGEEAEEPSVFWPWLLVLCGVYACGAIWLARWTQTDLSAELRESRAEKRHGSLRSRAGGVSLLLVAGMLLAAVLRIVIALNVEGYQVDVGCFSSWGATMFSNGPAKFYQTTSFCDYPPGYIWVMGLSEGLYRLFGGRVSLAFAHKIVPMLCDLLAALLIVRVASEHGCTKKQSSLIGLLIAFNPAIILNSAAWCQVDSALCFLLMLVAYLAIHRKWAAVLPVYVVSVLAKPQALMMGFLGLAAIIMDMARTLPQRRNGKLCFHKVWKDMGVGLLISLGAALAIILPFSVSQPSLSWLFELYGDTLASYPYATVNTANLFYLFGGNWRSIMYNAEGGVTALFLLMSAAWCAFTFVKRRDRRMTLLEPALAMVLTAALALGALGVIGLASGDGGYMLTTGNPWRVYSTDDGYVREFISGVEGAWAAEVSPVLLIVLSVVLLALSGAMGYGLIRRVRSGQQESVCTGLLEPALMLLFTIVFAFMLIFDTTWGALGVVSMALAFAVVLPMFIRSGQLKLLPLCGAVLFILLYVFGVKMHERYLFPALFLLGMAYAMHRDRRLLWLLVGLSCTVFLNEGIVLDNAIRLGAEYGHLNQDTHELACLIAAVNTALAIWSVRLCHAVCVEGAQPRLTGAKDEPLLPVRTWPEAPCTPLNHEDTSRVKWGRIDALLIAVVTLVYSVVTFTTLGSTKAPQNPWTSTNADEQVIIDLGANYTDFSMLYYAQVSYNDFTVETSDDCVTWTEDRLYWAEMAEGQCFRWKYLVPSYVQEGERTYPGTSSTAGVQKLSGRYVRITAQYQRSQNPLILNEVIFRDAEGERIDASIVASQNVDLFSIYCSDPNNLLDEQDTLDGEPGWWNSTYFDEIYHARTGFEHATGHDAYEWTHPPLGKIIMSWFISLFGMTPFGWRFAGALCGVLMLPAMYLLGKQLTKRTSMGFAAMLLMTLDCMHFTQTRIATIDSYPVLFIILSCFFMLRFMQRDIVRTPVKRLLPDLALSGFFMGCGVASKWIAIYAGVGLAVMYFWTCIRHLRIGMDCARMKRSGKAFTPEELDVLEKRDEPAMKRVIVLCLWCLLFFVAVPLAIYLASYVVHYQARDLASAGDFLRLVFDTQVNMLNYHGTPGLGMDHAFYSPWYEWMTMQTPMYYASPSFTPDGWSYAIFCFGNPAVWYVGLAGVAYAVYRWVKAHRYRLEGSPGTWHVLADTWDIAPAFVLIGLLAQLLPWILVPRGTYIYHYFASVPFLILGTVLLLNAVLKRWPRGGRKLMIAYLCVCLVLFVVLFPYASGVLTPESWMNFVRDYPWFDSYLRTHDDAFVRGVSDLMQAIPLFPHVYH